MDVTLALYPLDRGLLILFYVSNIYALVEESISPCMFYKPEGRCFSHLPGKTGNMQSV